MKAHISDCKYDAERAVSEWRVAFEISPCIPSDTSPSKVTPHIFFQTVQTARNQVSKCLRLMEEVALKPLQILTSCFCICLPNISPVLFVQKCLLLPCFPLDSVVYNLYSIPHIYFDLSFLKEKKAS